ncbi:hypothetical protein ACH5RR_002258 [Cinchona calisaya]|uniref:RRM domain-containing protein n=1 Tax=Cinchona calisaya TaxID=153742 RepID=A0ABD3B5Q4_9GENT
MNGGDLNQQQQQRQQWMAMQQYQQQWMSMHMQYPAAAMLMQQQMLYAGHQYVPATAAAYYHHHQLYQQQRQQQQHQQNQIQNSSEENRTIWIGDLQQWMDENYLQSCFAQASEVISVMVIRNKQTGESERYGFVEFSSHAEADKVLQSYNGSSMPNSEQVFRLSWAAFSLDSLLHETFSSRYPSVKGTKVVVDPNTGRPKGYGFVRFADANEGTRALTEMNGAYCSSRPMRIGVATPKKASPQQQFSSQGLDSDVTDEELRESFSQFGDVVSVKIASANGCGFVQFSNRSNAEDAMQRLNGAAIGKQNPVKKQFKMDSSHQWNGTNYARQGRNGY